MGVNRPSDEDSCDWLVQWVAKGLELWCLCEPLEILFAYAQFINITQV